MLSVHSLDGGRLLGEAKWDAMMDEPLTLSPDGVYVAAPLWGDALMATAVRTC